MVLSGQYNIIVQIMHKIGLEHLHDFIECNILVIDCAFVSSTNNSAVHWSSRSKSKLVPSGLTLLFGWDSVAGSRSVGLSAKLSSSIPSELCIEYTWLRYVRKLTYVLEHPWMPQVMWNPASLECINRKWVKNTDTVANLLPQQGHIILRYLTKPMQCN